MGPDSRNAGVPQFGMSGGDPFLGGSLGLIPRTLYQLFDHVDAANQYTGDSVRVSYIEIYMEDVKDLLVAPRTAFQHQLPKCMEIREDTDRGIYLPEATVVPCFNVNDVMEVLRQGNLQRKMASTASNQTSSRSHAILLVSVHHDNRSSQLYLCDLAGSERVKKTQVAGVNLTESTYINKGLLSLGLVIQKLVKVHKVSYSHFHVYTCLQNQYVYVDDDLWNHCVDWNSTTYTISRF